MFSLCSRAKLFRFSKELNEWKERGTGEVRVLQHKTTDKFRLLMRRDKTLKICLNHYVNKTMELRENMGSDRSWVWSAVDYADGERDQCMLAIRFANTENAQKFKKAYDIARKFADEKSKGKNPPRPESLVVDDDDDTSDKKKGSTAEEKKEAKPKSSMAAALQEAEKLQENAEKMSTATAEDTTKKSETTIETPAANSDAKDAASEKKSEETKPEEKKPEETKAES